MSEARDFPERVRNFVAGEFVPAASGEWIPKFDPHDGELLCEVARSSATDVDDAVRAARMAQPEWAATPPVRRGQILFDVCAAMKARRADIAKIVARETGKSPSSALGETDGAIALGMFYAGEGQRLYGRTTTSGSPHKYASTIRVPCGVAGLIVAANTPIANVAWKTFPALICGNGVVLKAAEDTPATARVVAEIARAAGLPDGVFNVVQGLGAEAGQALAEHPGVDVVSFTGSTRVGRIVGEACARRLAKCSLELGGKNPLVVCDDADLSQAVKWISLSAYSNAGQRCASASRAILFDAIYDEMKNRLVEDAAAQKVGPTDEDDFGPVVNSRQLENMLRAVERAEAAGARVLVGGRRLTGPRHEKGYYMAPTVIEGASPDAEISRTELFGPVLCLYRVANFEEALALANDSPYGLTACIHTRNVHRAIEFAQRVQAGVAVVNAGTFGSEPHMPFGGVKQSGNGSREPGTEALDVYSELRDVYMCTNPAGL